MYCNKCGTKIESSDKFCSSCGISQKKENNLSNGQNDDISMGKIKNEVKMKFEESNQSGKLYMIIGWISMVVSLLFIPVLFGAISVIMGYLYRDYDHKHGTIIMIAGIAGAIFGFLFGMSVGY